jgi:hypothetical protein
MASGGPPRTASGRSQRGHNNDPSPTSGFRVQRAHLLVVLDPSERRGLAHGGACHVVCGGERGEDGNVVGENGRGR